MLHFNTLSRWRSFGSATASHATRGTFTPAAVALVAVALCMGSAGLASAQAYHDHFHARARDYMAQAYPGGFGPPAGSWRYGLAAHRPRDRAYPMTEWSGPSTATGGPSGGIN